MDQFKQLAEDFKLHYATDLQGVQIIQVQMDSNDIMSRLTKLIDVMRLIPKENEMRLVYGKRMMDYSSEFKLISQKHCKDMEECI